MERRRAFDEIGNRKRNKSGRTEIRDPLISVKVIRGSPGSKIKENDDFTLNELS